jgi:hypothetical protein
MAQIFHPSMNTISKLSIVIGAIAPILLGAAVYAGNMTYGSRVNVPIEQPVQFSHKHHLIDDGIDCRYCHTSVEKAAFAGMPSTETCMTCHSQIWSDSPLLEPVRKSWETGEPIEWTRVNDQPDFVFFNHSIHIKKGVGCVTCHGRVDQMPMMWKDKTMSMAWCVDCHRNPEKQIRPRDKVFEMAWSAQEDQEKMGLRLVKEYKILPAQQLTNCSICHR